LMINNCRNSQPLPIYGDGSNVRDWIHVSDHCEGIFRAINKGISGEVYNFGGNHELTNLEICKTIIEKLNSSEDLITFVDDRLGHDFRYAIDNSKASKKLDWKPIISFEEGIVDTIEWYISNSAWLDKITSGEYRDYYKLYKLIIHYVNNEINDKNLKEMVKSNSNFTPYKDLDDKKTYPEELIASINVFICNMLQSLNKIYEVRLSQNKSKENLQTGGFFIGNYVKTVKHKNDTIKHKLELYADFMDFFNVNHTKILDQINKKMSQISEEITKDIDFKAMGMNLDDTTDSNIFDDDDENNGQST